MARPRGIAPVRPNLGIEVEYRRRVHAELDDMQRSLLYWLSAAYRANPPAMALDKSPATTLQETLNKLAERWGRRFQDMGSKLAGHFAASAQNRADRALASTLRKGGTTVKFQMTPTMRDAYDAVSHQQAGLIRSIADQHLGQVQTLVMQSVQQGRDLSTLTKQLEDRFELTRKRASLIAHHQNNLATATFNRVRQIEVGGPGARAVWVHSGAGREPRPGHVRAGRDQLEYDVHKGAYIDGAWIQPGEMPRCRCSSRLIITGFK